MDFLNSDGEMAGRIRAFDWSATPLGAMNAWPQSLKTAVGLMTAAPNAMVLLWGPEGVLIYNDAYARFAGRRHPELLGLGAREGWPEIADFNDANIRRGLAGEAWSLRDQNLILDRQGRPEPVWMDLDYTPVPDESGRPAGVLVFVTETTGRIEATRLEAEANHRLDMALSAGSGVGTWQWDISADRVYADARFAQIYGVDPAVAARGAPIGEFFHAIHPDDADRVQKEIARALASDGLFKSEYRLIQQNGDVRWVAAEGRAIRNEDGVPVQFPGVTFDITGWHQVADALAESEARYRTLFESTATGFCIVQMKFDADDRAVDYRIVEGNPAYEDLTGLHGSAGKWVSEIAPGLERHWFDLYGGVALTGEPVRFENPADIFGRWYDVQALRVGEPEAHQVAILFNDITERKRLEARQTALLELTDLLRDTTDPEVIAHASSAILARALNVTRAGYGVMDVEAETVTIARDYNAPGMTSIAGTLRFRDFGSYIDDLARGETVVVTDTATDPRTRDTAKALAGIGVSSFINMPLLEQGRVVALAFVNNVTPRFWSDSDVELLRDFAARVRIAVERARSEAELRESETRYRALFDAIDEGFCIIEFIDGPHGPLSDYVHVEANAAYAENAGIPDVVGQKVRQMVGDEAQAWIDLYKGVLDTGQPIRFEKELEATGRWLDLAAFRVEPPGRKQVAVLFKDLTARKRAEEALRRLNETLEQRVSEALAERRLMADLVDGADAFVQVADKDLRWVAINRASADEFERIYGVRPHAGQRMADVLGDQPEHLAAVEAVWRRAVDGDAFIEVSEFGADSLDRRSYEMRFSPLFDSEGRRVGAYQFVYDVTERLAEQARLKQAEEALRQSQKMEAVGQLTGGIAHDFNNLLAGISGSLELLNKRLGEGRLQGVERYIDAAQGAAQRAAALTQRLLAFSRRQTLDPRVIDANKLISGMEELVRRTVGPDVEVEVVGSAGLWRTRVDPSQLENALLNLCINARDAMAPNGGHLTIETANKWLDDRAARERDLQTGQYVSLCVSDTGAGMPPEVVEKIFEPFFTTKPTGQGTGLGLSMIHGFMRQSGGQVRVYSEPGKGTTMCLYLPRWLGEADEEAAAIAAGDGAVGHGEVVLVIDDEPTVRMLVTEVLSDAGYAVIEAPDGPSGLRILEAGGRIDLLVTDVGLPGGMNGRQVADAARVARPDLKVLFITGYAENAAVRNGLLDPGMAVITKPFVMGDLADKVREMIEGG